MKVSSCSSSISSSATVLALLLVTVHGSPLNFPGSEVSLSSRVPNPCLTTDGTTCVFPFTYLGVEYYQCTYSRSVSSVLILNIKYEIYP